MTKRKSTIARYAEAVNFIQHYLLENISTSAIDQEFHEEFEYRFGGKEKVLLDWQNHCNTFAMRVLKRMYDSGQLRRYGLKVDEDYDGRPPKWVYVYSLTEREKTSLQNSAVRFSSQPTGNHSDVDY